MIKNYEQKEDKEEDGHETVWFDGLQIWNNGHYRMTDCVTQISIYAYFFRTISKCLTIQSFVVVVVVVVFVAFEHKTTDMKKVSNTFIFV